MKILFYQYGNICEPDLIDQFKTMGLQVVSVDREINDKAIKNETRIKLVNDRLANDSFLFVFSINFFPGISDLCQIYGIPYVCWTVDSPLIELYSKSICNSVNRIFVFDKSQFESVSKFTNNVALLPLATNVTRWDYVNSGISDTDIQKFFGDISFVGSLYTDNDALKKVSINKACLDIIETSYAGPDKPYTLANESMNKVVEELANKFPQMFLGWDSALIDAKEYIALNQLIGMHYSSIDRLEYLRALGSRFSVNLFTRSDTTGLKDVHGIKLCGGVSTLTEMPKVFRLSRINLNMTIRPIENGLPLRIWDVLGCGGFLLTNYCDMLMDYFEPGKDLDFFESADELVEKCDFYLKHEDIRAKIAVQGYEKVKNYHSYMNRMPAIIKSIM